MNQKHDGIELRKSLRAKAAAMVGSLSPAETTTRPTEVLMHELLVHKVELEMQIEELRRVRAELEEARDLYVERYEFAPVGYLIINREGLIDEINLAGAALLGIDRARLVKRRFSKSVAPQAADRWHRLFLSMMEDADRQAFGLEMTGAGGSNFHAHLSCLRRESAASPASLWVVLSDPSKIERGGNE